MRIQLFIASLFLTVNSFAKDDAFLKVFEEKLTNSLKPCKLFSNPAMPAELAKGVATGFMDMHTDVELKNLKLNFDIIGQEMKAHCDLSTAIAKARNKEEQKIEVAEGRMTVDCKLNKKDIKLDAEKSTSGGIIARAFTDNINIELTFDPAKPSLGRSLSVRDNGTFTKSLAPGLGDISVGDNFLERLIFKTKTRVTCYPETLKSVPVAKPIVEEIKNLPPKVNVLSDKAASDVKDGDKRESKAAQPNEEARPEEVKPADTERK